MTLTAIVLEVLSEPAGVAMVLALQAAAMVALRRPLAACLPERRAHREPVAGEPAAVADAAPAAIPLGHQIERLSAILEPSFAVATRAGAAHGHASAEVASARYHLARLREDLAAMAAPTGARQTRAGLPPATEARAAHPVPLAA